MPAIEVDNAQSAVPQGCTIEIVPNGTLDGDPDMLCRLVPGSLV